MSDEGRILRFHGDFDWPPATIVTFNFDQILAELCDGTAAEAAVEAPIVPPLRVTSYSGAQCMQCGAALLVNYEAWLVGPHLAHIESNSDVCPNVDCPSKDGPVSGTRSTLDDDE